MNVWVSLWLFAPAAVANMAPVLANNIPILRNFTQPLDGGKRFRGKRILGSHKTIRGLIGAVFGGVVATLLQMLIYITLGWPAEGAGPLDYGSALTILYGACLGFGAITGDAIKSFFKRQLGILPGHNWVPFDQLDFVVGGILASLLFFRLDWRYYLLVLLVGFILHPLTNLVSWLLRLQDKPF